MKGQGSASRADSRLRAKTSGYGLAPRFPLSRGDCEALVQEASQGGKTQVCLCQSLRSLDAINKTKLFRHTWPGCALLPESLVTQGLPFHMTLIFGNQTLLGPKEMESRISLFNLVNCIHQHNSSSLHITPLFTPRMRPQPRRALTLLLTGGNWVIMG